MIRGSTYANSVVDWMRRIVLAIYKRVQKAIKHLKDVATALSRTLGANKYYY
jgi:hypothetical protein